MSGYRVNVDVYNGPLDLLLYLIRRDEVDIYDIPIARIAEQYARHVEVLNIIDPNIAGDFLVMLATLMEVKSRAMLPRTLAVEDDDGELIDPRVDLVRQLLAYKTFKDAAHRLGTAAEVHGLRYPRQPVGPPPDSGEMDLEDVSIWALVNAFGALLEQTGRDKPTHEVVVDDTPMALHADDIIDALSQQGGSRLFEAIFIGRTKFEMIGLFLALLELIRRRRIRITQDRQFGPITVHLIDATPLNREELEPESAEIEPYASPTAIGGEDGVDDPDVEMDDSTDDSDVSFETPQTEPRPSGSGLSQLAEPRPSGSGFAIDVETDSMSAVDDDDDETDDWDREQVSGDETSLAVDDSAAREAET